MSMFKQKKYTSTSGNVYTFQHPGVRSATQIGDRTKNKYGVQLEEKIADEMFKYVIVDPKVSWDYFGDNKQEFNEVVGGALKFVEGMDDDEEEESNGDI
ncbi:hypothetical protein JNUCC42_13210 [Brevibacterium sp. JNUCC-42]|nr:hypothetical protein JNUCC42_13210 [Brevibacterium sp. JNUCC-42]